MRIIPKKVKIKNTIWKWLTFADILVAFAMLVVILLAVTAENWIFVAIAAVATVFLLIPTSDGCFYTYIFILLKFLLGRKKFLRSKEKDLPLKGTVDMLCGIKGLGANGQIEYSNGYFGRVIKVGQKNFHIEDLNSQNADIENFADIWKLLEGSQCAELVKIDRPVNLNVFSKEYFDRLQVLKNTDDGDPRVKAVRIAVLEERIDAIDNLNNLQQEYVSDYYIVFYSRNAGDLDRLAAGASFELSKIGLSSQMLDMRETAVFLKYSFSRNFDEREILEVEDDSLLEWVLPKELTFSGNHYTVDGTEASVYTVSDYPLYVQNAWGSNVFDVPNTKVVMHISPVEKSKAISRIDRVIGEMEVRQISSDRASEATSADTHRETMEALLNSLQRENENLLDVNMTVTTYNYLSENTYKKAVRRALAVENFKVSTLYGMQAQGFEAASVSPAMKLKNYTTGINSSSLAAVFPFVRTSCMEEGGIWLGYNYDNGYPFIFNLWKRDLIYQNSNAIVIGKPGSGKTYFLATLIVNEWSNGTRIIVLDPEAEYITLTHNLCGNLIDVGSAREGRINPFHIYKILTEDGTPAPPSVTFNTHLKMLESFFQIVLAKVEPLVLELINNLVVEMYAEKGITEKTDCSEFAAEEFPLFSDLLALVQNKDKAKMDELEREEYRKAEVYLQKFVTGRYSDIWNEPSTLQVNADIIDFNFQSLFANKNNVVANAQMLLVFRFIEQEIINARERNRAGDKVKTMIVVDEAHLFIDPEFPIALDFFCSMNKRIRKYGGSFIPATQNISDWTVNETCKGKSSTIIKNCQYTFIFKLSEPDMEDLLTLYRSGGGFNDDEQKMILRAERGQAFFVGAAEYRSSIGIHAGELVQALFEEDGIGGAIWEE